MSKRAPGSRLSTARRLRPLPFVVVAPATVMVLGALVALVVLVVGTRRLEQQAYEAADFRAEVLGHALAARLVDASSGAERVLLLERAAQDPGHAALLVEAGGRLIATAPGAASELALPVPLKARGEAAFFGALGRYVTVPLTEDGVREGSRAKRTGGGPEAERLVLFVRIQRPELSRASLVTSLLTFALLLLGATGFVAWALTRDVHADVLYLRRLIVAMAEDATADTRPIPVRTIDQVGQLTASFNTLLGRFRAAERAYRQDLTQASAFDQDRSAFLAALSHELRTPLNAILGFTDVLLSEIDGPLSAEVRENLTIVRTSGEHLRSLIDDILALGALESGQFRLSREELSVASVASDVVTESVVTADQKGIYLELTELSSAPVQAYADRRRLRQILQNVIANAVKFTTRGGVVVAVTREGDDAVVTVSDTGPGIAPEALERIFNEFAQAGDNLQRQGTGLGLSITRRLVQMHGGSVRAESTLGQGSTFTIRLPLDIRQRKSAPDLVGPIPEPVIRDL